MENCLREGFVLAEDLRFSALGTGLIELAVECIGGLVRQVNKLIRVISGSGPKATVQAAAYSYHAWIRGGSTVFRYDSPHDDHNRFHHVTALTRSEAATEPDVSGLTPKTRGPRSRMC